MEHSLPNTSQKKAETLPDINRKTRFSISRGYLTFAWILITLIAVINIIYAFSVYKHYQKKLEEDIILISKDVDYSFTNSLDYIIYIMQFLRNQIQKNGDNINYINNLYSGFKQDLKVQDLSSWSMFDWVTPDKQIRLTSSIGILDKPVDLSFSKNLEYADVEPGKVFFNTPRVGRISKQYILPASIAVPNNSGGIYGYINIGIHIPPLLKRVEQTIKNENIKVIILDENYAPLTEPDKPIPVVPINVKSSHSNGFIKTPFEIDGFVYQYIGSLSKYPFYALVGVNKSSIYSDLVSTMLPPILALAIAGIASVWLMYLLYRRLIEPIIQLSNLTGVAAHNETFVSMPDSKFPEINQLSKQITLIKEYQLQAEQASRAKSNFLASMSHELRTPLHTIIGYTDSMKLGIYGKLPPKHDEIIGVVQTSAKHQLALIDDILDLAKIEAGKMELLEVSINIENRLEQAIQMVQKKADDKNIKLSLVVEDDLPSLMTDEVKFRQMILNLLSNSLKFTPEGGEISIRAYLTPDGNLAIEIKDTGIGVDENEIPSILKEFSQAKGLSKRHKEEGAGLGLAIVNRIMTLHKGSLTFTSQPYLGTTVTLFFPKERTVKTPL